LQGLTLPWVIRILGLGGLAGPNCEEREARRIVTRAALQRLEESRVSDDPELADIYDDLKEHYQHRLTKLETAGNGDESSDHQYLRVVALNLELLRTERNTALALRAEGRINDEVMRTLEHELDLRESELTLGEQQIA
jgi:CPA1 family monovalent cation:H+ antiporter